MSEQGRRGFLASFGALLAAPVAAARAVSEMHFAGPLTIAGEAVDWSRFGQPIVGQMCEFTPTINKAALDDIGRQIDEFARTVNGLAAPFDPPYGSAAWFFA